MATLVAGCAGIAMNCGGDDTDTTGGGGTAGQTSDGGKDATSEAKGGSGGTAGTDGGAGKAGDGSAGTGGTGGTAGGDGGPRDSSDATGGTAGKGGTAGTGGAAGTAGTGGSAGTQGGTAGVAGTGGAAGAAGTGGTAGTDGGSGDASGGAAGNDGGGGGDGAGGAPPDVNTDAGADASDASDDGSDGDGGSVCTVDNTACSNGGSNGLCKSQVCAACTDGPGGDAGGDDGNCSTAYGGQQLCLSGVCTPGNCRVNGDCTGNATGPLCGIAQAHFCGKCSTDAQCLAASPATPVCNTGSGLCVASAGSCNSQADNTVCSINSADVCCGSACTPGECCPGASGDTVCKTKLSNNAAVCSPGHQCTVCDPVAGLTFIVDPASGVDNGATGSGTSSGGANASCAFKTVTRALQAIGLNPAPGTVIQIRNTGPVSVAGNGETFPINVTTNVTITAVGGAVTVTPSAAQIAFAFASAGSGINGTLGGGSLVIDGATNTATSGVAVNTGSTDATTLQNVTIQNFAQTGIQVLAGRFTIKQGVLVTGTGTTGARRPGLLVTGTGHADITVPNGQATTAFNNNTQHGILVNGGGSVTIAGSQSGGTGTIEARGNYVAGLAIQQTPGNGLALNGVTGFLAVGTTNGNGIRIEGGSNVKVRDSYSIGNAGSGVVVVTSVIGGTRNNVLTNIDLGTATADAGATDGGGTPGGNVFQATIGSNPNAGAGICLQMDGNSGTLSAQGNMFSGGKNCATTAASLTFSGTACSAFRDLGLTAARGGGSTTGNDIDVTLCTHP